MNKRILQTADWHVHPRHLNCHYALERLVDRAIQLKPDLILISGDIFDTRDKIDPRSIEIVRSTVARLRRVSDVLVIPGNHDAANAWGNPDSVTAVLGEALDGLSYTDEGIDHHLRPLVVASRPGVHYIGGIHVAAVPWPSKYHLQATGAGLAQEEGVVPERDIVDLLGDVIRGLAVEISNKSGPKVLTFHGAVEGGVFDNERMIGVGQEVTIPRDFLPGPWDLILAGHLHRRQHVAGVHYPGAITQFSFAQAGYQPGFIVADWDGEEWTVVNEDLEVAVPFVSIKVDRDDDAQGGLLEEIRAQIVEANIHTPGTRVQVKAKAPAADFVEWALDEQAIRRAWPSVNFRFILEKIPPTRIRSEVTVESKTDDLLDEWIRLNESLEPIAGRLRIFARNIEQSVGPVARSTSGASYRPIVTTLENFKIYGEARIEWTELPRLTCIKGPNASGKTTAARAEPFALFGAPALEGSPLRRVVKDGSKKGLVRHIFRADEKIYKVERSVTLTGTGKLVGGDVSLAVHGLEAAKIPLGSVVDLEWRSLNGANARETQAKIEALVGTPEMFFSTRFARQDEINKLLKITPQARKRLLQDALQTARFYALEEDGRRFLVSSRKAADHVKHDLKDRLEKAVELPAKKEALEAVNAKTSELDKDIRKVNLALRADKENLVKAQGLKDEIWKGLTKRATLVSDINRRAEKAGKLLETLVELEQLTVQAEAIAEQIDYLDELTQEEKKLALLAEEGAKYQREIEKAVEAIAGAERGRRRQIETLEKDLEALQKKTAILASVPCQTQKHLAPTMADITKGCQFLLEAIAAKEEIPRAEQAIKVLKDDKTYLEDHLARKKTLEDEALEIGDDTDRLDKIREMIAEMDGGELNKKAQKIAGAQGRLDEINQELERIEKETEELEHRRDQITVTEQDHADAKALVSKLSEQIGSHEMTLRLHADDQKKIIRKVGELTAQVNALKGLHEEAKDLERTLQGLELDVAVATAYVAAVGADGIPFLILERALPQIQDSMNDLLEGSPLSVTIDPVRDLESGKARDDVTINFTDAMGTQVLEDASGYQENILGVALRAAVAELQAERAGIRPEFFVVDEGFGAYDPENIPHGREMLHRLAGRFGKVVFITHVPEVQEAAEAEIIVRPAEAGSTLEVVR